MNAFVFLILCDDFSNLTAPHNDGLSTSQRSIENSPAVQRRVSRPLRVSPVGTTEHSNQAEEPVEYIAIVHDVQKGAALDRLG